MSLAIFARTAVSSNSATGQFLGGQLLFNGSTVEKYKNNRGVRQYIIYGLTREQQIKFILRRDNSFTPDSFARLTDKEVRNIALSVDKNFIADRQKRKK
jgi:hypothetical protein